MKKRPLDFTYLDKNNQILNQNKAQEKFEGIRIEYKEKEHPIYECLPCKILIEYPDCLFHPKVHSC
jgi:hypothetical protein